jgi:hypothetical protein
MGEYASKHQVTHLELPASHEPLAIAPELLTVPCISESCLASSLVDEVDVITSELVLRGFVVCLDTGETPPYLACKMSRRDNTSTGTVTRAVRSGSLFGGARSLICSSDWIKLDGHEDF